MRLLPKIMVIAAALAFSAAGQCTAQDSTQVSPELEEVIEAHGDSTAMVTVMGRELFAVSAASVVSADERAEALSERILEIAKSYRHNPGELRAVRDDRVKATMIMSRTVYISAVWDYESDILGIDNQELAEQRLEAIRQAIVDYRKDISARSIIKGGIFSVAAVAIFLVIIMVISRLRRRLTDFLEKKLVGRTLFKVISGEGVIAFVRAVDRLVYLIFFIWLLLVTLNYILTLFPWTHGIAYQVFEMAVGPLKTFGTAFLEQIPSLFFLAFIVVITVFILRGIRFFSNEIAKESITIRGFYPDWAKPTFNIIRLIVIAFAIVVAFPYIPGSNSGAFKGMSLFIGILVSLGSGSAMANIISGIFLIYMRPFARGDRIQIGETVGDVLDRTLLRTRLLTPKNERVTIPNSQVLAGQIINFTSKAAVKDLILHTTVTIGYDAPWRTVHSLLIDAAKATENIIDEPEPFVLQKTLHDFFVEYELNAYTKKPRRIPDTYSVLHENIQDKFNEAGVEILSPHFRTHRQDDIES